MACNRKGESRCTSLKFNKSGRVSARRASIPLGGVSLTSFGVRYDDRADQIDHEAAREKDGKSGRKALNRSARQRDEGWQQVPVEDDLKAEILLEDPMVVVAGAQSRWARLRKIELADLMDQKWILYPPNSVPAATVEKAFLARGLALPRASVTTHSHYPRDILLATGQYLAVTPVSMLGVYNRNRVAVKRLAIDLDINSSPMAIFTLRHRTLSPVIELFIECVRATAKTIHS
jgi:hypothetical protein